jgi:uncharacterized protein (DUF885 family)
MIHRRHFLHTCGLTLLLAQVGCASTPRSQSTSADARLKALLDSFFDEQLNDRPEFATALGLDSGSRAHLRSRLSDASYAGRERWVAANRSRLARLRAFPETGLSEIGRFDRKAVLWSLQRLVEGGTSFRFAPVEHRDAPFSPYAVSHLSGPYPSVSDLLESFHPVTTTADAESYLERLGAFARITDDTTAALRIDAAQGVLAPGFILDAAIAKLGRVRSAAAAESALVRPLARRAAAAQLPGEWRERASRIVEQQIYAAVDRQIAAVRELRPGASSDAGVWRLPDGQAFYAGALRFHTTTDLLPDEVHRTGLAQVAELQPLLDGLLGSAGLSQGSVGERLTALSVRSDQIFSNDHQGRAAILGYLAEQVSGLRPLMGRAFSVVPSAPIEIVRVPPEIEQGAPAGYASQPSFDGSRPDRFFVNLARTADWPRFSLPTLAFHEGMPGHLWHSAILALRPDRPMMRRLREGFGAYSEGWALYAEQLADELGAYRDDPLGRIGYLQSLLFRAVRLVVDTGLHDGRWSREQAADYFIRNIGTSRAASLREIDRYVVWPGQACSYKVGHNEWVRLRETARAEAGARFDIRRFHDLLALGPMPLQVLDELVRSTDWT